MCQKGENFKKDTTNTHTNTHTGARTQAYMKRLADSRHIFTGTYIGLQLA